MAGDIKRIAEEKKVKKQPEPHGPGCVINQNKPKTFNMLINDECYSYIQLVTPNVVAIAVNILMMTLMMVFQVSVLIFSLMILRN